MYTGRFMHVSMWVQHTGWEEEHLTLLDGNLCWEEEHLTYISTTWKSSRLYGTPTIIIFISLSYNSLVWGRGLQGAGYAADVDDADRQYWHPHTVNAISISIFIDLINTSAVYMLDIHITVLLQYYGLSWWYFTYCVRFYSHENNGKLYNTFSYALPQ